MTRLLALIVAALIAMPVTVTAEEWYEGGTLHEATIAQWCKATPENRLATASDWTVALLGEAAILKIGMGGLKVAAGALVDCLNTGTEDVANSDQGVNTYAAMCAMMMQWPVQK